MRTFFVRPDAGQKSQNNASDITADGSYTLVGNASCFCAVDQPPVAGLAAAPTSGKAPLTVGFDGSTSSDPDAGDGVGSYTFNFGDGSAPVTQAGATISHTYTSPSSSSGYFATLTVTDAKCGRQSLNVASVNIQVTGNRGRRGRTNAAQASFQLTPMMNPFRHELSFALALDRDGPVRVRVFSSAGRRVADLLDAWMPAGTHRLSWSGRDVSGSPAAAGVYFVQARTGSRVTAARVVLLP